MGENEKVSDLAPRHGYTRLFLGAIRVAGFLLAITIVAITITALT